MILETVKSSCLYCASELVHMRHDRFAAKAYMFKMISDYAVLAETEKLRQRIMQSIQLWTAIVRLGYVRQRKILFFLSWNFCTRSVICCYNSYECGCRVLCNGTLSASQMFCMNWNSSSCLLTSMCRKIKAQSVFRLDLWSATQFSVGWSTLRPVYWKRIKDGRDRLGEGKLVSTKYAKQAKWPTASKTQDFRTSPTQVFLKKLIWAVLDKVFVPWSRGF